MVLQEGIEDTGWVIRFDLADGISLSVRHDDVETIDKLCREEVPIVRAGLTARQPQCHEQCQTTRVTTPCPPRCWGVCAVCSKRRCDLPEGHEEHCMCGCSVGSEQKDDAVAGKQEDEETATEEYRRRRRSCEFWSVREGDIE